MHHWMFHLRVLVNYIVMRIHVPSGLTVVEAFFKLHFCGDDHYSQGV